jgi:uncharacterized protein (PEP-CTERM system associated)
MVSAQAQEIANEAPPRNALHLEASVAAEATETSNVNMTPVAVSDTVLSVSPSLRVLGRGAGWKIDGQVGVTALVNLQHRGSDRLLPRTDLALTTQIIDRWLSIDARAAGSSERASPYSGSSGSTSTANLQNTYLMTFSPTLDHELGPNARVFARSANTWLNQSVGGASTRSTLGNHEAWYETRPLPLGWRAEASRLDSRTQGLSEPVLQQDTLRGIATYAVDPQFAVSLRGGHEQVAYGTNSTSDKIIGVGARWQPSDRTRLDTSAEQHFYGPSWNLAATHRNPGMSLRVDGARELGTYAGTIGTLGTGGSVASLLDSLLASRITDPALRSAAVQDIITKRGLPTSVASPVQIVSNRAEIRSTASVTLGLLGSRHVVSLRIYAQHTHDLPGEFALGGLSGDARQNGWSLGLNRKLSTQTSADLTVAHAQTKGEGDNLGQDSTDNSLRLSASYRIAPNTVLSGGARRVLVKSTLFGDANESAIFAGALHRF